MTQPRKRLLKAGIEHSSTTLEDALTTRPTKRYEIASLNCSFCLLVVTLSCNDVAKIDATPLHSEQNWNTKYSTLWSVSPSLLVPPPHSWLPHLQYMLVAVVIELMSVKSMHWYFYLASWIFGSGRAGWGWGGGRHMFSGINLKSICEETSLEINAFLICCSWDRQTTTNKWINKWSFRNFIYVHTFIHTCL